MRRAHTGGGQPAGCFVKLFSPFFLQNSLYYYLHALFVWQERTVIDYFVLPEDRPYLRNCGDFDILFHDHSVVESILLLGWEIEFVSHDCVLFTLRIELHEYSVSWKVPIGSMQIGVSGVCSLLQSRAVFALPPWKIPPGVHLSISSLENVDPKKRHLSGPFNSLKQVNCCLPSLSVWLIPKYFFTPGILKHPQYLRFLFR